MVENKRFKLKKFRIIFLLTLLFTLSIFLTTAGYAILSEPSNINLAEIVNGQSRNTNYINSYLRSHNNFEGLEFRNVEQKVTSQMRIGNDINNLKGYKLNFKNYAIHLIYCEKTSNSCFFRINGIPTKRIYSTEIKSENIQKSFNIDDRYQLKINSINFDSCGELNYCDAGSEAFDLVNILIEEISP